MADTTNRLGLDIYAQGDGPWSHTDTVELFDELAVQTDLLSNRPASGTYDNELFYATDARTLYRWDAGTTTWNEAAGFGTSSDRLDSTQYLTEVDADTVTTNTTLTDPSGTSHTGQLADSADIPTTGTGLVDEGSNTFGLDVIASGSVTLSSGTATIDTGITGSETHTFMLAIGPTTQDANVAGDIINSSSSGNYEVQIEETDTSVGNPTVEYDIVRVR